MIELTNKKKKKSGRPQRRARLRARRLARDRHRRRQSTALVRRHRDRSRRREFRLSPYRTTLSWHSSPCTAPSAKTVRCSRFSKIAASPTPGKASPRAASLSTKFPRRRNSPLTVWRRLTGNHPPRPATFIAAALRDQSAPSGSTVGVYIVNEASQVASALSEAAKYDNELLVEEFIPGRELTIGVLGDRRPADSRDHSQERILRLQRQVSVS